MFAGARDAAGPPGECPGVSKLTGRGELGSGTPSLALSGEVGAGCKGLGALGLSPIGSFANGFLGDWGLEPSQTW